MAAIFEMNLNVVRYLEGELPESVLADFLLGRSHAKDSALSRTVGASVRRAPRC